MSKIISFMFILCVITASLAGMVVSDLKCEYQTGLVGVDTSHPRLSWILESSDYDQTQTAYQILVADQPELLTENEANYWNSRKTHTDQSINIRYDGKPLQSLTRYYWKVRAWDKDDQVTAWSPVGNWMTGLMNPDEIEAKWITWSRPLEHEAYHSNMPIDLNDARWLWRAVDTPLSKLAPETLLFSRTVDLKNTRQLKSALILLTADDTFRLRVNGTPVGAGDSWQVASMYDVLKYLRDGSNLFEIEIKNTSPGPGGMICKIAWQDANEQKVLVSDSAWQVRQLELQSSSEPGPVRELHRYGNGPWGRVGGPGQDTFWTQDNAPVR